MPVNNRVKSGAVVAIAAAVLALGLGGRAMAQFPDPPPQPEAAPGPVIGTTTPIRPVSLRAGPNADTPVIGTLRPGDQLEILAIANYGWTEVRSPAGTGWAYGSYLASGLNPAGVPASGMNPVPGTAFPPSGVSPPPTATGPLPSNAARNTQGIFSP